MSIQKPARILDLLLIALSLSCSACVFVLPMAAIYTPNILFASETWRELRWCSVPSSSFIFSMMSELLAYFQFPSDHSKLTGVNQIFLGLELLLSLSPCHECSKASISHCTECIVSSWVPIFTRFVSSTKAKTTNCKTFCVIAPTRVVPSPDSLILTNVCTR